MTRIEEDAKDDKGGIEADGSHRANGLGKLVEEHGLCKRVRVDELCASSRTGDRF